jgi:hypothetical protein
MNPLALIAVLGHLNFAHALAAARTGGLVSVIDAPRMKPARKWLLAARELDDPSLATGNRAYRRARTRKARLRDKTARRMAKASIW